MTNKNLNKNKINKNYLCTENAQNSIYYDDFVMKIINKSNENTNFVALTCDTNKMHLIDTVAINVGYLLTCHKKRVLLVNMDVDNDSLSDFLGSEQDKVFAYNNIDIILPKTIDYVGNKNIDDFKNEYKDYDFVIFIVPSPKHSSNYLALPKEVNYYFLVCKYLSSYYSVNKCIKKIEDANSSVLGSVYLKIK